ncbi:MAG: tRNA uridine-5-carboxymethylaminomethyl(34) synthesis GTPase MnmE [Spirochaetales bacterium]
MQSQEHPIVAIATPLAPSALAVLRLSGHGTLTLLAKRFDRPERIEAAAGHSMVHGRFIGADGAPLDEVLVSVFRAPRSYTGEEAAEISCHGSPAGVRRIYGELLRAGFAAAEPGEFTRRAFGNGKLDLTQAEAVNEIVCAQTAVAHSLALDRLEGAVAREMTAIRERLVTLMAQLSIQLDYPEEDSGEVSLDREALSEVGGRIRELAATFDRGRLYQEGARVALAGRTNAGKSSLFNRLLRQERSIVSDVHGTTRDYLEAVIDVGGIPVRLFDTAGLRLAGEAVEEEGIRRSGEIIRAAELVLYVIDGSIGLTPEDRERMAAIPEHVAVITVSNKSDLAAGHVSSATSSSVAVSAVTGEGVSELFALVERTLLEPTLVGSGGAGQDGGVAIDSERQHSALVRAADAIEETEASLEAGMPADAVAVDLQEAILAIGEITGEVASAEILDKMFGSFCVGK